MGQNKLNQIFFTNYKAFKESTKVEIKPITLLVGKNSSGKSSICKLLPLLSGGMNLSRRSPIQLTNQGVCLGTRYEDLFHYGDYTNLQIGVGYENGISIETAYLMYNGTFMPHRYSVTSDAVTHSYTLSQDDTPFHGLIYDEALREEGIDPASLGFDVDYIGPVRKMPERMIYAQDAQNLLLDVEGKFAFSFLLDSYLKKSCLFQNVSDWMEKYFEQQKLEINYMGPETGAYGLYVNRNGAIINIADMGQGLAQVLPIIVESFNENHADITVMEQPEIHVHPAGHAPIAERLGLSAKLMKRKYVIETHSENILLAFRKMVADRALDFGPEDIVIYFVDQDHEGAFLKKISMNEDGELSSWPEGVFGEGYELLMDIMRNRI